MAQNNSVAQSRREQAVVRAAFAYRYKNLSVFNGRNFSRVVKYEAAVKGSAVFLGKKNGDGIGKLGPAECAKRKTCADEESAYKSAYVEYPLFFHSAFPP